MSNLIVPIAKATTIAVIGFHRTVGTCAATFTTAVVEDIAPRHVVIDRVIPVEVDLRLVEEVLTLIQMIRHLAVTNRCVVHAEVLLTSVASVNR